MEVFFDSNVFLYHLADEKPEVTKLLHKVESREIRGFINDIVISEVIYGFLRAYTGLNPFELKKRIKSIDLKILKPLNDLFSFFTVLPLKIGREIIKIMENYKLLPNDALIAATCKYYGIRKIATFDDDFSRVYFLEIIDPSKL